MGWMMTQPVDPLDEDYDPLEEVFLEPDEEGVPGGCGADEGDDDGFGREVANTRKRAATLAGHTGFETAAKGQTRREVDRRKRVFLAALSQTGVLAHAAAKAGWSVGAARYHKEQDKAFEKAWEAAIDVSADMLELEAVRRAMHGTPEPVWDRGGKDRDPSILGFIPKYSDTLMMALLKARRPEKFRERYELDHKGESGGGVLVVPGTIPLDQWSIAAAKQQAQYRDKREDDE